MKQSSVDAVIRGLKKAGVSIVCYLPDSLFKELYPALDADPDIRTIRVTNEGEGAAICGGVGEPANGLVLARVAAREGGEDFLYVVVRRRLGGSWRRCVERMASRRFASINDLPISADERLFHWEQGTRPADHPGLTELGL